MNDEIYLTALDPDNYLENPIPIKVPKAKEKKKEKPFFISEVNQIAHKKIELAKETKENFLTFLIHEKTHFANFEEAENHYQMKLMSNINKFNANKSLLQSKKDDYTKLLMAIESQILAVYRMNHCSLNHYYETSISDVRQNILHKEHDLECYQNNYKRLYKSNYLIKKRFDDEIKYQYPNDKQYAQYKILKNNAVSSFLKENVRNNNLKDYYDEFSAANNEALDNKTRYYDFCKEEVAMVKKEIKEFESNMNILKKRQIKLIEEIRHQKKINIKYAEEYKWDKKEYFNKKGKLLGVFSFLNTKNLPEFIISINKHRQINQTLHTRSNSLNTIIINLKNDESTLEQRRKDIIARTIIKHEEYQKMLSVQDSNHMIYSLLTRIQSENNKDKIKGEKLKECIEQLLLFFHSHILQIGDIIHTLKPLYKSDQYKHYHKYFMKIKDSYILNINQIVCNKEFFQFCLAFFNNFSQFIFTIISNCFQGIGRKSLLPNEENSTMDLNDNQLNRTSITYFHFIEEFKKAIQLSSLNFNKETKKQVSSRNDEEASIKTNKFQPKNRETASIQEETVEDLYKSYIDYMEKDTSMNSERKSFFIKQYNHNMKMFNHYSTNLLPFGYINDRTNPSKKNQHLQKNLVFSQQYSKNEDKESSKKILNDDSYEDFLRKKPDEDNVIIKQVKSYSICDKEKEMFLNRMNDLRRLDLHFYQNKDKDNTQLSNSNEIYYHFKRRFHQSVVKKRLILKQSTNKTQSQEFLSKQRSMIDIQKSSIGMPSISSMKITDNSILNLPKRITSTPHMIHVENAPLPESTHNKTHIQAYDYLNKSKMN